MLFEEVGEMADASILAGARMGLVNPGGGDVNAEAPPRTPLNDADDTALPPIGNDHDGGPLCKPQSPVGGICGRLRGVQLISLTKSHTRTRT